ncbi:MAG TPA: HAMP domain-containing sensor histidine kinase [Gaiellaceae bacterium]|nr:HAMP domain-containing sensor histidine kinase [Gaiellaceae bacterium]
MTRLLSRRLTIRTRLLLASAATATAVLAAAIVAGNILLRHSLDADATRLAHARLAAAIATLQIRGGSLAVSEAPDQASLDVPVWVVDRRGRVLEQPVGTSASLRAAVVRLTGAPYARTATVSDPDTRLAASPIVSGGRRRGAAIAAVALAPYQRTERLALLYSTGLGALLLALGILASHLLLRRAFRPVSQMTLQAREWSEHDPDRRFSPGTPNDELSELADTLDQLLDRVTDALRREQRFGAELAHELRTPLTRIIGRAELAIRAQPTSASEQPALASIHENAVVMQRTLDALMAAARHESSNTHMRADVADAIELARREIGADAERRHLTLTFPDPAAGVRVAVDNELLLRILAPLLENACTYTHTTITVAIEQERRTVTIHVQDDGPGVPPDEREHIFEPAVRGSNAKPGTGAGLGLALARRLARAAGGDITLSPRSAGASFAVVLPRA